MKCSPRARHGKVLGGPGGGACAPAFASLISANVLPLRRSHKRAALLSSGSRSYQARSRDKGVSESSDTATTFERYCRRSHAADALKSLCFSSQGRRNSAKAPRS